MKTVFTKGMTVYDNVFFPNSKGEVVRIDKHYDSERVIVRFDNWDSEASYTEIGRLVATYSGATPTLSTSSYTLQGFEQKEAVPTLDGAINWLKDNDLDTVLVEDSRATYFTKKENYFAFDALRKLIIFRDYYNQGWQPNWCDYKQTKYIIENYMDEIWTEDGHRTSSILAFKTPEIRDKFLEEQRELLEIAKPLL